MHTMKTACRYLTMVGHIRQAFENNINQYEHTTNIRNSYKGIRKS